MFLQLVPFKRMPEDREELHRGELLIFGLLFADHCHRISFPNLGGCGSDDYIQTMDREIGVALCLAVTVHK